MPESPGVGSDASTDADGEPWGELVTRFLAGSTDPDLVEGVARGYVAAMVDGTLDRAISHDRLLQLSRALVVQSSVVCDPPALHTIIANHQSGGHPEIIELAATRLEQVLIDLLDGSPSKNVVLMSILLRRGLGERISQNIITELHLAAVSEFTAADLSLPYSCAFTEAFDLNRDDIRTVLADDCRRDRFVASLPYVHRLVFEWLTGMRFGLSVPLEPVVDPASDAARRTLSARRSTEAGTPVDTDEPTVEAIAELLTQVGRRSESLPTPGSAIGGAAARLADRRWMAIHGATSIARRTVHIRRPRRPKVAVCISGQLRGYRVAAATWRRSLFADADCDLFVHTWSNIGRSSAEGFRATLPFSGQEFSSAYRQAALLVGFDEVKERYPALFNALERSEQVDRGQLADFYGSEHVVVDDDRSERFAGWTNQDKMHWKIQSAFDLIPSGAADYDLVVRVRPDKPIEFTAFSWRDLLDVCRRTPTILADSAAGVHYAKLVIGDQFAIGSPAAMSVYSSTYSVYPELAAAGLYECPPELSGHSSLAQVCWLHGIDVTRAPVKFGQLEEVAPLRPAEVLACLEIDAARRNDDVDRRLLSAARSDAERG